MDYSFVIQILFKDNVIHVFHENPRHKHRFAHSESSDTFCCLTSCVWHQVMQLAGMLQNSQPFGALTVSPSLHCF